MLKLNLYRKIMCVHLSLNIFIVLFAGGEEEVEMAEAEVKIMNALGWKGHGLITAQNSSSNKGG